SLQARIRALQLTLLEFAHAPAHQALQGRAREAPQRHQEDASEKRLAAGGEAVEGEAGGAEYETDEQRSTLTDLRNTPADEPGLHHHGAKSDQCQHEANGSGIPTVAVAHVKHGDTRQRDVREVVQK